MATELALSSMRIRAMLKHFAIFKLHLVLAAGLIALNLLAASARADTYTITLDPSARDEPATGRIILFFITQTGPRWTRTEPKDAPFFSSPQPIASIEVRDLKPGESVTIDSRTPAFPDSLDTLDGTVRVQAVLDADQTERSFDDGPGNVYSDTATVDVSVQRDDAVSLTLIHRIEPRKPRADLPNLRWVSMRSPLLSKFYGRDVYHRAGVALPPGYNDPGFPRQQWPAIYVIPGFGGREEAATRYLAMMASPGASSTMPMAAYIVLDPEAPLGHHGFVDSASNGPRETALLTEFIPYLESQFKLVAKPEARLITGHSSGGWSSLWLQLQHPDVFGACWSSSPDPVDFSAFQMTDLYADESMYADAQGSDTPSYRRGTIAEEQPRVLMTVRQECGMECAIDPNGRSGQQWDAWEAMFSPRDAAMDRPARMFDRASGAINKDVVAQWARFDIARLVTQHWDFYGDIVINRVRLACGDRDSYYLNRAVERLQKKIDSLKPGNLDASAGYVLIVPGADHETVSSQIVQRWNSEMRQYLQRKGLQDAERVPAK